MTQSPTDTMDSHTVSAVFGDSSTSYMLIQSANTASAGASAAPVQVKALVLSGTAAGTIVDVPNNVTVSDNLSYQAKPASQTGSNLLMTLIIIFLSWLFAADSVVVTRRKSKRLSFMNESNRHKKICDIKLPWE